MSFRRAIASWVVRHFGPKPQQQFMRSIYKGAESSRLTADWFASLSTSDDELRWSAPRLRARARDLARNNAYARAYLRLLADNVIGADGIKLQAQVRDNSTTLNRRINDRIEDAWEDWSRNVTIGVPLTLTAFSRQVLRGVARDGEVLVRLWRGYSNIYAFALEALDADQLDEQLSRARGTNGDNEIRMGVELSESGLPVAYHVWESPPYTTSVESTRRRLRIPADQIIHLYDPDRIDQTRGVTWLAAAMYPLKMLDGYEEAELVASRVNASKMGFFAKKDDGTSGFPTAASIEIESNPGTFETLPPGYELQTFDPTHPGQQYAPFVKTQLRKIASALGISYNVLANDLEGVNYSSMRSGMLCERDTWNTLQSWWISIFLTRVYSEWLNLSQLAGALKLDTRDPAKLRESKWTARGWPWVDPLKDVQAGIAGISVGLACRSDLLAEQGLDFEEVLERLAQEEALAREYGVDISGSGSDGATDPQSGAEPAQEDAATDGQRLGARRLAALLSRNNHKDGDSI